MSRITKYLRQKCSYEKIKRDEKGNVMLDKFGEPLYEASETIQCRREITVQDVQTNTGAILKSTTRYFTDEKHIIGAGDKLDGKTVLKVLDYIDSFGSLEGYESYV